MKKLLSDTGFLAWIGIMGSPFLFAASSTVLPEKATPVLWGVYIGSVSAFFILCKNCRTLQEIPLRISLLQLVIGTLGFGAELGIIIAFSHSHSTDYRVALFLALIAAPTVAASNIVLSNQNLKKL